MRIVITDPVKIIMRNPNSHHNYFGWPTVARLQNGKIAVVASGFRRRHVCPFGKTVISFSEDGGITWSEPKRAFDKSGEQPVKSDCAKPTVLPDGRVALLGYQYFREDPNLPLGNAETGACWTTNCSSAYPKMAAEHSVRAW